MLVSKLELDEYVHFAGNQKDVRPYYEIATIFTLTSVSVETFSIAALEAMCYGLPISLTRIGGAEEMIIDDINGTLSEPGNPSSIAASWKKLLSMNINRDRIRELVINNFSLEKIYHHYRQELELP